MECRLQHSIATNRHFGSDTTSVPRHGVPTVGTSTTADPRHAGRSTRRSASARRYTTYMTYRGMSLTLHTHWYHGTWQLSCWGWAHPCCTNDNHAVATVLVTAMHASMTNILPPRRPRARPSPTSTHLPLDRAPLPVSVCKCAHAAWLANRSPRLTLTG